MFWQGIFMGQGAGLQSRQEVRKIRFGKVRFTQPWQPSTLRRQNPFSVLFCGKHLRKGLMKVKNYLQTNYLRWIIIASVFAAVVAAVVVHHVYGTDIIYTHLFYLPILLTGFWFPSKALYVAGLLGGLHIACDYAANHVLVVPALARTFNFFLAAWLVKTLTEKNHALMEKLQAMFNGHSAVMLLIEPATGKIVDANPAACAYYGYNREELLNLRIQDINTLPEEEVRRRRLLALQEKQTYFLFPHRLKNGEIRLVDVYSCPITHGRENVVFSIIFDVTDREKYKEELHREKELLHTTLFSIGDGVVTTDNTGKITAMNEAAQAMTGWSEEEAKGLPFSAVFKLISEATGEPVEDPIGKVLATGRIIGLANHTALVAKGGRQVPIADSAAPIRDSKGRTFGVVMVFRDVSQEKESEKKILYASYHDPLTGLYNRRFAEEELRRLDASRDVPLAVIIGDVNGLKLANDVFGHEAGDRLLKRAAQAIRESCRQEDIVARWGGDEFLVLLPRTSAQTAEEIIGRIKERCLKDSGQDVQLSIALGCGVKVRTGQSLRQTIKEAEECMYRLKLLEGKSYRNVIINTLLTTLFEKSMETEQHAERLQAYCLALGRKLNLPPKDLDELAILAKLHDIGKVAVPEEILQKSGPLTAEEWEKIKKHPAIGYRIAQNTPELAAVAEYILCNHERWDGKGYPRGLKGQEIPLLCRILAVADAYDAMTSGRSYRKAMRREEAMAEIQRNAGTQFDPLVADLFLEELAEESAS